MKRKSVVLLALCIGASACEVLAPACTADLSDRVEPTAATLAVGEQVKIKTKPHVEGERRVEGVLAEADADGAVVDGRRVAYDDIERARTVFEWGPAPKSPRAKRPHNSREVTR